MLCCFTGSLNIKKAPLGSVIVPTSVWHWDQRVLADGEEADGEEADGEEVHSDEVTWTIKVQYKRRGAPLGVPDALRQELCNMWGDELDSSTFGRTPSVVRSAGDAEVKEMMAKPETIFKGADCVIAAGDALVKSAQVVQLLTHFQDDVHVLAMEDAGFMLAIEEHNKSATVKSATVDVCIVRCVSDNCMAKSTLDKVSLSKCDGAPTDFKTWSLANGIAVIDYYVQKALKPSAL